MSRSRYARAYAVVLAIVLLAAGCGSGSGSDNGKLTSFKSAVFPGETYALDYIADKKGFFSDHGLEVTYLKPQSGAAAVQMIAGGQIQGWSTAPAIIYNAAAQGQPVKLGGLINGYTAYEVLAKSGESWVKPDASFDEKVRSLSGKTIGVSGLSAGTDLSLLAALSSAGVKADDVKRLGVGTTLAGLGQLKAGKIDAYVEFTGSGARLIHKAKAGDDYISLYGDDAPSEVDALSDLGVAVNSDYASKHPQVVKDWLAALNEARAWLVDAKNLDAATKIVADASYNGKNQAEVKSSLQALAANLRGTKAGFTADPARVDLQIKVLKDIGALKADAQVSSSSVILK
jgi:ABC-type nitrate/sulfonate/bicarbonate transport system substrate-binding protein